MKTTSRGNRLIAFFVAIGLTACGGPSVSRAPTQITLTSTSIPFFDAGMALPLTSAPPQSVTPPPSSTAMPPTEPRPTPGPGVLDFDPLNLILLAEEIPGPYAFFPALLEQNPNSGVLAKRGEKEGSQYINTTGRINGARAEFVTDFNDPSLFLVLGINLILFQTPAGPTFLFGEKGGPCRPEENPDFILLDTDLALGDISTLCTDGMEYWLRVGYRNVYFDVNVLGTPKAWDVDVLTEIALAQLMKLKALPPVESLAFPPIGTHTPKWTPTPAGTPEVFPTPSPGPSWITQDDNGKSFFYYPTIRFGIDLDPRRYLLRDLDITECPFIGQVSNWSLNGPDSLPVGFEAIEEGECTIRIRDFRAHIVVVDWP